MSGLSSVCCTSSILYFYNARVNILPLDDFVAMLLRVFIATESYNPIHVPVQSNDSMKLKGFNV